MLRWAGLCMALSMMCLAAMATSEAVAFQEQVLSMTGGENCLDECESDHVKKSWGLDKDGTYSCLKCLQEQIRINRAGGMGMGGIENAASNAATDASQSQRLNHLEAEERREAGENANARVKIDDLGRTSDERYRELSEKYTKMEEKWKESQSKLSDMEEKLKKMNEQLEKNSSKDKETNERVERVRLSDEELREKISELITAWNDFQTKPKRQPSVAILHREVGSRRSK